MIALSNCPSRGFFTWNYIKGETQPVDTAQTELVSFEIEQGASVKEVSKALWKRRDYP